MGRLIGLFMGMGALVCGLAFSMNVFSHHAFSSEFDANRPFRVQGSIVKVEWINPHSWVHVDVTEEDGDVVPWMMEGGTPNSLLRAGLTRKLLTPGTEIIVRLSEQGSGLRAQVSREWSRHYLHRWPSALHGLVRHGRTERWCGSDGRRRRTGTA